MRVRLHIDILTEHPVELLGALIIEQPAVTVTVSDRAGVPPLYGRLMGAIAAEKPLASATDATEDTEGTQT